MLERRRVVLLTLALIPGLSLSAWACLWYYGTKLDRHPVEVNGGPPERLVAELKDHQEHDRLKAKALGPEPGENDDFKLRSDYAASLVYKGQARRAVEILESVEGRKPGEYVVAANLGTAYELAGDDEKALHWIREGIRRNKDAHGGTEWLHALILEAKLMLAKDPSWLRTNTVLGLDFGSEPVPKSPPGWGKGGHAEGTRLALEYQLNERMGFVREPDPIVADLLMALGDTLAVSHTAEHAIAVYDLALEYEPVRSDFALKRREALKTIAANRRSVLWGPRGLLLAAAVVALSIAGGLAVARRRRSDAHPAP